MAVMHSSTGIISHINNILRFTPVVTLGDPDDERERGSVTRSTVAGSALGWQ